MKAGVFQENAILIEGETDDCVEFSDCVLPEAEKELASFARAVSRLVGSAYVHQSIEYWVEEFESIDWPSGETIPDWRRVTIAAAARIASRMEIEN